MRRMRISCLALAVTGMAVSCRPVSYDANDEGVVAFGCGNRVVIREVDGTARSFVPGIGRVSGVRLAPGGGHIVLQNGPSLVIYSLGPRPSKVLEVDNALYREPAWSPDGSRIAFVSDRSGTEEIWSADVDGSNVVRHTHFSGPLPSSPSWSPDGRSLVFDVPVGDGIEANEIVVVVDGHGT